MYIYMCRRHNKGIARHVVQRCHRWVSCICSTEVVQVLTLVARYISWHNQLICAVHGDSLVTFSDVRTEPWKCCVCNANRMLQSIHQYVVIDCVELHWSNQSSQLQPCPYHPTSLRCRSSLAVVPSPLSVHDGMLIEMDRVRCSCRDECSVVLQSLFQQALRKMAS